MRAHMAVQRRSVLARRALLRHRALSSQQEAEKQACSCAFCITVEIPASLTKGSANPCQTHTCGLKGAETVRAGYLSWIRLKMCAPADAAEADSGATPIEQADVDAAVAARSGNMERPPPWLDVTTALQFMADDGRLLFHEVAS